MPNPNTNDFTVFDKKETNCQYVFFGVGTLDTFAVERPLTVSRGRNVERYVPLKASDRVFHVDASGFEGYSLSPAALDSTGIVAEIHDRFLFDGLELIVLFAEFQDFRQSAIVICRST